MPCKTVKPVSQVVWQCIDIFDAVGTTLYISKFTKKIEQLPAAVGFVAAKGSDKMLADFVSKLFENSYAVHMLSLKQCKIKLLLVAEFIIASRLSSL
jgi:hypothetical protein